MNVPFSMLVWLARRSRRTSKPGRGARDRVMDDVLGMDEETVDAAAAEVPLREKEDESSCL